MTSTLTDVEKINRLPWLVGASTLNIVFVLLTFSGSVFILFLDELNAAPPLTYPNMTDVAARNQIEGQEK